MVETDEEDEHNHPGQRVHSSLAPNPTGTSRGANGYHSNLEMDPKWHLLSKLGLPDPIPGSIQEERFNYIWKAKMENQVKIFRLANGPKENPNLR